MYCGKAVENLWKSTGTLGAFTFCYIGRDRLQPSPLQSLSSGGDLLLALHHVQHHLPGGPARRHVQRRPKVVDQLITQYLGSL